MRIVIAGGGTGGHVFPMVAVGDAVRALEPGARVTYVGTARGIEARVLPERGDALELLRVLPLRGGGPMGFLRGAARAAAVVPEARALVRRLAPDVVLSAGGYAAGPVSLAARSLGVPLAVLEPNSHLGLTNRLLAPLAARAYLAFPEAARFFRPSIVRDTGVPLRKAFGRAPYAPEPGHLRVLVLGGSQGAKALNEAVPEALAGAAGEGLRVTVVHQAGPGNLEALSASYARLSRQGLEATPVAFVDDVASKIAWADVVVGRAGASTLAEICAVGRPSILVPYPFAADDHQRKNAESLEAAGGAVCVVQREASASRLAAELLGLGRNPARAARMAEAAASRGRPGASLEVARDLVDLARSGGKRRLSLARAASPAGPGAAGETGETGRAA